MAGNTNDDSDLADLPASIAVLREYAPHPYQSLNSDGEILTVNDAWLDLMGYRRENVEGRWFGEFLAPDSAEMFRSRFSEFKSTGGVSNVEFDMKCADGELITVSFDGTIEYDEDEAVSRTHCQFTEITEQKDREQELDEANTVLRTIVENMPMGVLVEDADRDILMTNERLPEILGVPVAVDDLIGQDCAVAAENLKELFAEPESFVNVINRHIADREPVHNEELELADGRVLERDYIPYTLPDGPANLWIYRDITERKESEQKLETQRNNLEVLNQVLRHDIRNNLQLVTAFADMLEESVDENQDYVQTIQENARQAIELTTTSRDMAEVWLSESDEKRQISLQSPLENVLDEMRAVHADSDITVNGDISDVTVVADDMLSSVMRNLLQNAIQHNTKDTPKVEVSTEELEETVVVRVADNGSQVPDSQKETIFGKGEKGLGSSGTGLGLYLVKTLMEKYGGNIRVADNEPEGTVFAIELQKASPEK